MNISYTPSPSSTHEDPFESPLISPALIFYTAPSTPIVDSPVAQTQFSLHTPTSGGFSPAYSSPNAMPLPEQIAHNAALSPTTDDLFPEILEPPDDTLDDDGLNNLERIYLYSRSKSSFHRVFIANALPELLEQVTPHEAIEYVLPLLTPLAMDEDEMVKEAFSSKLVTIIWWFFTHCQLIPGDVVDENSMDPPDFQDHASTPTISVQAFTPILGTLLLNPNVLVGGATRYAVVALLGRIKRVNAIESQLGTNYPNVRVQASHLSEPAEKSKTGSLLPETDDDQDLVIGLFGKDERALFEKEILFQVVVGMGRLDNYEDEDLQELQREPVGSQLSQTNNPYFPPVASAYVVSARPLDGSPLSTSSTGSSNSSPGSTASSTTPSSEGTSPLSNHSPRPSELPSSSGSTVTGLASPTVGIPSSPSTPNHHTEEEGEYDQAAIGRLSSMSLMAAVAASGYLDDHSTDIFVAEVERVSQDPVFWVRREACFALGALAKVVPPEVVQLTLMRLLQKFVSDPIHHVRHSSLFALPTILGRLPLSERHRVALDIMVPMSMDESADVRAAVLEALGEVIYTFYEDDNATPPEELLKMFLGRTKDRRVIDGRQPIPSDEEVKPTPPITDKQEALEAFYTDPSRPLICAFNFPAVTLTVGRARWQSTLRDTYLWLAGINNVGVRRTLAASLGEMAKILGEKYAQNDLLGVWRRAFHTPEDDVRLKLIDCLVPFVGALPLDGQLEVFNAVLDTWTSNAFTSWREREGIAKILNDMLNVGGTEVTEIVRKLMLHALVDSVNTVREAAIFILPNLWLTFKGKNLLDGIRAEFLCMARSEMSRRRMTYLACQQALLLPGPEGKSPSMEIDDDLCATLATLASDNIVGVRIGVARLIGFIHGMAAHSKSTDNSWYHL
ncbi:armadillo-type protein [Rhodocollybia butyracea]|uniref:Armadillo-type protein n=1 Tax=Rhodocollybia butyracea TaxID=206335 RepID=A0A9P5PXJ2_9AGAR|nr:armadillo-type protein [Rhodocollybia butyracea]